MKKCIQLVERRSELLMYQVDDLIMYGSTGVCKVKEITRQDFGGAHADKLYYVLEPLCQSGVIYAPVDNKKVFMRPVISENEAKDLIDSIPQIHTEIYKNSSMQQLTKHYQAILDTHGCRELLGLIKSISMKKVEAVNNNRTLGQIDKKFMKRAEDLLFGEFAAALHVSRDEVEVYVHNRLDQ